MNSSVGAVLGAGLIFLEGNLVYGFSGRYLSSGRRIDHFSFREPLVVH
jgi:hypothetical protein